MLGTFVSSNKEKIVKMTLKIDSLIMMILGWMTSGSICVYECGSSVKSANDLCFESHFCKSSQIDETRRSSICRSASSNKQVLVTE